MQNTPSKRLADIQFEENELIKENVKYPTATNLFRFHLKTLNLFFI